MHVIKAAAGETQDLSDRPLFDGGQVWRRALAGAPATAGNDAAVSGDFSFAIVQFAAGARTLPHRHTSDQILYVLAGIGKVGAAQEERVISAGDFAFIPAHEDHWHGAADTGSPMSHIAITRSDSTTTIST
ncbi:MAG: cupin domain-containing protein [Dehalococcoidia bacterium]